MQKTTTLWSTILLTFVLTSCGSKPQTQSLSESPVKTETHISMSETKVESAIITSSNAILNDDERQKVAFQHLDILQRIDQGELLSVYDIISLHQAGISDIKILNLIDYTHSQYHLTAFSLHKLEKAGVSDRVINYMIRR